MTQEFRADIHCHSTLSDGSYTPEDIFKTAKEIGLSGLSITDHDTVEAYKSAIPLAKESGITLVPGIEFSTVLDGRSVHVLAYSFNVNHPSLLTFCERHQRRRLHRNKVILEKLTKAGMPVSEKQLVEVSQPSSTIGRPHIAKAMIANGYVSNINQAFAKYIGDGKSCYATGDSFSTEETLHLIHELNGIAVIAHPHLIHHAPTVTRLLNMPFDGIECYYARLMPSQERPWRQIAEKKGWVMTGGSDFHGSVKPDIPLGCSWVGKETFDLLYNRYVENTT